MKGAWEGQMKACLGALCISATLAAWLEHQGDVRATAGALHVHAQTVRYRVAQLREVFGEALDDGRGRLELALALRVAGPP